MCPACQEPLIVFELDGVEIDRCLRCGGTWLDAGEFSQLARYGRGTDDPFERALASAGMGRTGDRRCVRCSTKMKVAAVQTVEIDRCPRGHGHWFDANEIEALLSLYQQGGLAKFFGQFRPSKPAMGG